MQIAPRVVLQVRAMYSLVKSAISHDERHYSLHRHPDHITSDIDLDNKDQVLLPDLLFINMIDMELAEEFQKLMESTNDLTIQTALQALNGVCAPPMKSTLSDWHFTDGILFYKDRAYVPTNIYKCIPQLHHNHPTAGHPRRSITEWNVKKAYWWPGMGTYIRKFVDGCTMCQQMKVITHPTTPP
jgi:hypothetical protein